MGDGSYFCAFANVPVVMVQGNGQQLNAVSDSYGSFNFSVTQGDTVSIYIPDYNGNQWRSSVSVATTSSVSLSTVGQVYSYSEPSKNQLYQFKYEAVTIDGGRWVKVLEKVNNVVTINAGNDVLTSLFQQYSTGNVKYVVNGAIYNYYKRLTYKSLFDFYDNFAITWGSTNNTLNKDFKMYSTYSDLIFDKNAWQ